MPIQLHFQKAHGPSVSKGPFERIVFEGEMIREKEAGPVIATHLAHTWDVDGDEFLRLDVKPQVVVSWEGFGGNAATTGYLTSINGIAYIDRRMFAVADRERSDWYLLREGEHHAIFFVDPAP